MPKHKALKIRYWMYDVNGGCSVDRFRDVRLSVAKRGRDLQTEIHKQISSGNSWGCVTRPADLELYPIPDGLGLTKRLRDFTPSEESCIPESAPLSGVFDDTKKPGVIVVLSVLILRCGVFDPSTRPSTRPFLVCVPGTAYADELQESIEQTRSSGGCTADLELYKIDHPANNYPSNVTTSDLASPLYHEKLSDVFPVVPPDDTVQVLVIHQEMKVECWTLTMRNPRTITIRRDATIWDLYEEIRELHDFRGHNTLVIIEFYNVKCWSTKSIFSDLVLLSGDQMLSDVFPLPPVPEKNPIIVGWVTVQYWLRGSDPDAGGIFEMPLMSTVYDLILVVKATNSALRELPNDRLTLFKIPVGVDPETKLKEFLGATSAFPTDVEPERQRLVLSQYLKDIFWDFPLLRPLAIVVEIVPEKALKPLSRMVMPTTESLAEYRRKFVQNAKSIPPSVAAKSSTFRTQQESPDTAMDCGHPDNCHGRIPLVLLHSVFSRFARNCATVVPEENDNLLAIRLMDRASGFFANEHHRVEAIDEVLKAFNFITAQLSEEYTTNKALVYKGHHLAILEHKEEMAGISLDPYHQALSYYFSWTKDMALTSWWSPLPCFLIIIVGPFMAFAGAAWNQRPTADMLTSFFPLIAHPENTLARDCVARHLVALRAALDELESYYRTLHNSPSIDSECSQLFPHTTSYKSLQGKEDCSKEFKYTAHVGQLLFEGEQAGQPIYIKFVQSYGKAAHQHLADLGCAPTLLGCEPIGGGWILIVMDKLCGYETLQACEGRKPEPSAVETLHSNLCLFHKAGYVHGDIRDINIMISEYGDHLMVIDFDWAGEAGVARYPGCVNYTDIDRPQDARDGKLITEEHDDWMIDKIKALERTRHIQSINAEPNATAR